jgi:hypothetical protein
MIKDFLLKKMLKSQLDKAGIPASEQERIIKIVSENPELFKKVAEEVEEKVKNSMSQQQAMMEVMQAHQGELAEILKS